ncbi:nudix hydrolase 9 [Hordeum vulgare]|nr:nudix hydrolase 9 [Hordeum vulgare]
MKCPSNYPLGFNKYELSSSILPIPVAIFNRVNYSANLSFTSTSFNCYVRVTMHDDIVYRRGTYVGGNNQRFDLQEHLIADFRWDLAEMKCSIDHPSGFTKNTMRGNVVYNRGTYVSGTNRCFDTLCIRGNEIYISKHLWFPKECTQDYLASYLAGVEATKAIVYNSCDHDNGLEVFWKAVKDGRAIIRRGWTKVMGTFDMEEGTLWVCRFFNTIDSQKDLQFSLHLYRLK